MTVKITSKSFQGLSGLHDGTLSAAVIALTTDLALAKVQNAQIGDLTDNTTGVAAASAANLVIPTTAFDATSAGGSQTTAFNTAMGKIENASAVMADHLNAVRARVGLSPLSWAVGTIAARATLPALDKSVTTANGATAIDFASGVTAMKKARENIRKLWNGYNEVRVALGYAKVASLFNFSQANTTPLVLADIPTATAHATGASSIAKTVMDTFLDSIANIFATMAIGFNLIATQGEIADLTDSSGGTAAAGLAANALPVAADGAATTSSPKAGFDAELVKIETNLSDLTLRMNLLRGAAGLAQYTDSTGASPNTTIEALLVDLTAVDGSTGTVAVEQASALARMTTIHSALKSLRVGVNELRALVGLEALTDALATGTASTTIANIAATATGVAGAGATLLDTEVDAWLVINRHNIATLAKGLNDVTGSGMVLTRPMSVVAG